MFSIPISVFLIYNYKNIPTRIVFEVSNTFGERHAYACKVNKKGVYNLKQDTFTFLLFLKQKENIKSISI